MEHITNNNIEQKMPCAVTLGNFDGLHEGHRTLIATAKKYAEEMNMKSVVFTFNPHPMFFFKNRELNKLIMSRHEKVYAVEKLGVDMFIEYPFEEIASMSPEDFAIEILFKKLNAKVIVVGDNYRFGSKAKGDPALLTKLGEEYGVKVIVENDVYVEGSIVSSTRVRECLVNRDVPTANMLLTEPYFMIGTVVKGKELGRQFGFPTVNLVADEDKLFPPNGVYATRVEVKGKLYCGVTNVGINPTVNGTFKIVETFIFDFNEFIYGEEIKISFFKWIRNEKKFNGVEELMAEIAKNTAQVKEYFSTEEFEFWKNKGY